jgi:putative transposase
MSQAISPSTAQPYGLARVCRVWGLARSTVYWQRREPSPGARRRGPLGPCTDDDLVAAIRRVLQASPFPGEGYRKVWARLRHSGLRTSPRRVLRLMRAYQLLAPTRQGHPHGPKAHDGTIIPAYVDTMWGTDMTATYTRQEGQVAIFIAVDHCSAECVGIHAAKQGTRFEALEPIRQGVRLHFGAFGQDIAQGLVLRHDHGSQYMSRVFQEELRFLGSASSPAFVREPEGNGCAERFIRTLKENLLWLKTFDTVEELRLALHEFQRQYNQEIRNRGSPHKKRPRLSLGR